MKKIPVKTFLIALAVILALLVLSFITHKRAKRMKEDVTRDRQMSQSTQGTFVWEDCKHNVSAANITGFDSLPANLKDFLYYRHCRHFPLLLDPTDKCGQDEVFLLLVIKSSLGNYERREVLRKTWAKERQINGLWVRRIFISGTTGDGFEKIRLNKRLELEQQQHNDIIQWDFKDTHCNLTLKQVLFLEWLDKNCPNVSFLLNGDDDVFAHTENMVEYLQSLEDDAGSRHLFAGFVRLNDPAVRTTQSKYFVPHEIHKPDLYPPYCSGGGILLSRYTALIMHRMSQSLPLFPMDDVYLGMILAKARLMLTSHMGFKTFGLEVPSKNLDRLDPCFYKDLLLVHRFLPTELYVMWKRVHDPDLKCFSRK
ncbi:N-acetyllactosaminide beta-1,3-N-acetylglucosaminyltransferase 3-like isoform X2 [Nelusetta ayraudi]